MCVRIPITLEDGGLFSVGTWDKNPSDPNATQRDIEVIRSSLPGESSQRKGFFRVKIIVNDPTFQLPVMGFHGMTPVLGVGQSVLSLPCTGTWDDFLDTMMLGVKRSLTIRETLLFPQLGSRTGHLVFKVALVQWEGFAIRWDDSLLRENSWRNLLAMVEMRQGVDVIQVHIDLELDTERMNVRQDL